MLRRHCESASCCQSTTVLQGMLKAPFPILALLAAVFLLTQPHATADTTYRFERMWPTLPQPWYLSRPAGLAVDTKGNLLISDAGFRRILKFTRDGQFITRWNGGPYLGLATDFDNNVYGTDQISGRVHKYNSSGERLSDFPDIFNNPNELKPAGIAFDGQYIYVVDNGNSRIVKLTTDGETVAERPLPGLCWGLAVDKQGVAYVVDCVNHGIQKYSTTTGEDLGFINVGQPKGFFDPALDMISVAVDEQGYVYVGITCEIRKYDPTGALVDKWGVFVDGDPWGIPGNKDGQFKWSMGMVADQAGRIYVADYNNDRVQVLTTDGQVLMKLGSADNVEGRFDGTTGFAFDSHGDCYEVDRYNAKVQKHSKQGEYLGSWPLRHDGGFAAAGGSIHISPQDEVYVQVSIRDAWETLLRNEIQKYTLDGQYLGTWSIPLADMIFRPNGNVLLTVRPSGWGSGNPFVYEYSPNGQLLTQWDLSAQGSVAGTLGQDKDGNIYVLFWWDRVVKKYSSNFVYQGGWDVFPSVSTNLHSPDLSFDSKGYLYVVNGPDRGVARSSPTSAPEIVVARSGSDAGQFLNPQGVTIDATDRLYVQDWQNDRVQVFAPVELSANSKAIIVAGCGPGDSLWDATQASANFAYRALTYQGFTKQSIYYLSENTTLDLDGNGIADDVDGTSSNANLEAGLTGWASALLNGLPTGNLVVYLVDHGGDSTFRISRTETLTASQLADWLDIAQASIQGRLTAVYDGCQSGSFVPALSAAGRVVVTSASSIESAYFLNSGTISFSNFFWTQIMNGNSVLDSFALATAAIGQTIGTQTPQLGDSSSLASTTFIGNGTEIVGSRPEIVAVTGAQTINNTSTAALWADPVTDADGISRVWAVVRPPDYAVTNPANPLVDLPSIEFQPVEGTDRWEASSSIFVTAGTYQIAVYARDKMTNVSLPKLTTVTVTNPLRRKAVIVAGGTASSPLWPAVEKNVLAAYDALRFQGYGDEDIRFYSPLTISSGVDGLNLKTNVQYVLSQWGADQSQDLVVYLIGSGSMNTFQLNGTEAISASELDTWLDQAQSAKTVEGKVLVVYDASYSGSFVSALTPPSGKQRLVLASSSATQMAAFLSGGSVCFSDFFWRRVLNGSPVNEAFKAASLAMNYSAKGPSAQLDDNGNGVANEKSDGLIAQKFMIGMGIMMAGDAPLIGSVSGPQTLDGSTSLATLYADQVTTTGIIARVWAVVTPPGFVEGGDPASLPEIDLVKTAPGHYEVVCRDFYETGDYDIAIFAQDTEGNISPPAVTTVTQNAALEPDAYEHDDTVNEPSWIGLDAATQIHTFHVGTDEDWAAFYAPAGEIVTIETFDLGPTSDTYLELYASDGVTLLVSNDDRGAGDWSSWMAYTIPANGVYYVRVTNVNPSVSGADTHYSLKVWREIGPCLSSGTVSGRVTDTATGQGVKSARLYINEMGTTLSWPTNQNGDYYITGLSAGTYTVRATATGYSDSAGLSVTLSCGSSAVSRNVAIQPKPPVLTLDATTRSAAFAAGTTTVRVSNTGFGSMAWSATVTQGADWLTVSSGSGGTDSGTVVLAFAKNPSINPRTGTVRIASTGATGSPTDVTVTQAGDTTPVLRVAPTGRTVGNTSGTVTFDVTNIGAGTMAWTAQVTQGAEWLSVLSGASGNNSGTVLLSCSANTAQEGRVGVVRVNAVGAYDSPVDVQVIQAGTTLPGKLALLSMTFARPGDIVSVPLNLEGVPTLTSYACDITYDPNVLDYLGCEPGPVTQAWAVPTEAKTAGRVRLSAQGTKMLSKAQAGSGGTLAVLQFQVLPEVVPPLQTTLGLEGALVNGGASAVYVGPGTLQIVDEEQMPLRGTPAIWLLVSVAALTRLRRHRSVQR